MQQAITPGRGSLERRLIADAGWTQDLRQYDFGAHAAPSRQDIALHAEKRSMSTGRWLIAQLAGVEPDNVVFTVDSGRLPDEVELRVEWEPARVRLFVNGEKAFDVER